MRIPPQNRSSCRPQKETQSIGSQRSLGGKATGQRVRGQTAHLRILMDLLTAVVMESLILVRLHLGGRGLGSSCRSRRGVVDSLLSTWSQL